MESPRVAMGQGVVRRHWAREVLLSLTLAHLIYAPGATYANPQGGVVLHGDARFDRTADQLTVTNAPGTIIDWQSFSIAEQEITRFVQEHAQSAVLNRVVGESLSQVLGRLESNGQVFLINPNGIVIGNGATIDTAGFVASTLSMSDDDFLAGRFAFGDGRAAGSISQGGIVIAREGPVLIVAPVIENSGLTRADNGDLLLAAGRQVLVTDARLTGVSFEVQAPNDRVLNLGQLIARGGSVGAFAGTLTSDGEISADSVTLAANGELVLGATSRVVADGATGGGITVGSSTTGGTTWVGGEISARAATGRGGQIDLLGAQIAVTGNVSAEGASGGGAIRIGGDYLGQGPLPTARAVYVAPDARVSADASVAGPGGRVIVWSDELTKMYGDISARGVDARGGFVETSSANLLDVRGSVDVSGGQGLGGSWLLDPLDLTVVAGTGLSNVLESPTNTFQPNSSSATIGVATIESALTGGVTVILDTNVSGPDSGDITWAAALDLDNTVGSNTLQLDAAGVIQFGTILDTTPGGQSLDLNLNSSFTVLGGDVSLGGGSLTISGSALLDTSTVRAASVNSPTLEVTPGASSLDVSGILSIGLLQIDPSAVLTIQNGVLTTSAITISGGGQLTQLAGTTQASSLDVIGTAVIPQLDANLTNISTGGSLSTQNFTATSILNVDGLLTVDTLNANSGTTTVSDTGEISTQLTGGFGDLLLDGTLSGLGVLDVQNTLDVGFSSTAQIDGVLLRIGAGASATVFDLGLVLGSGAFLVNFGTLNISVNTPISGVGLLRNDGTFFVSAETPGVLSIGTQFLQGPAATTLIQPGNELRLLGGGFLQGTVLASVGSADADLRFAGGTFQLGNNLSLLSGAGSLSRTFLEIGASLSVIDGASVSARGFDWLGTLTLGANSNFVAVGGGAWRGGTFSNSGTGPSVFLAQDPYGITGPFSKLVSGTDLVMTGPIFVQEGVTLGDGTTFALRGPNVSLSQVTFGQIGTNPLTALRLEDGVTIGRHAGVIFDVPTVLRTFRDNGTGARLNDFVFQADVSFLRGAIFDLGPRVIHEGVVLLAGGTPSQFFDSGGFLGVFEGTQLDAIGAGGVILETGATLVLSNTGGAIVHAVEPLQLNNGASIVGPGALDADTLTLTANNNLFAAIDVLGAATVIGTNNQLQGTLAAGSLTLAGDIFGAGQLLIANNATVASAGLRVATTVVGGTLDVSGASFLDGTIDAPSQVVIQSGSNIALLANVATQDLDWFESTVSGSGRIDVGVNLNILFGSGLHRLLDGATVQALPGSTATIDNTIALGNGATLEVSGTTTAFTDILIDPGAPSTFRNFGTLNISGPVSVGPRFDNSGVVDVGLGNEFALLGGGTSTSGTFVLQGNDGSGFVTIMADYRFDGINLVQGAPGDPGTTLRIVGGATLEQVGQGSLIDNLVLDGGFLRSTGTTPVVVDELTWLGGGFEGPGETVIDHLVMQTSAVKEIRDGQLVRLVANSALLSSWVDGNLSLSMGGSLRIDLGTLNFLDTSGGSIISSGGGPLNVQSGGRFNVGAGTSLDTTAPLLVGPGGMVDAVGTLQLLGGGTVLGEVRSSDQSVFFGAVQVSSGTLVLDQGGALRGLGANRIVVTPGGTLATPAAATATFEHGLLGGGTFQLDGALDAPDLQLAFGNVLGSPSGRLRLLGSSVIGDPDNLLRLVGLTVETNGLSTLIGSAVHFEGMARLEVAPTQSLQILDGSNTGGSYAPRLTASNGGGELIVRPGGTLIRPATSLLVASIETFLRQEGAIDILAGGLDLRGGGQLDGNVMLGGGALLAFTSNSYMLGVNNWQVGGTGLVRIDGGVLGIGGGDFVQLDAPTQLNAGTLNLGGMLLATNLFDMRGGLVATAATGRLDLGGVFAFEGGTLSGTGQTRITPTGALQMLTDANRIVRDGHIVTVSTQTMGNPLQSIWRNGLLTLQNNAVVEIEPDSFLQLQPETGVVKRLVDGGGATSTLRILSGTTADIQSGAPFVIETRVDVAPGAQLFASNSQVVLQGGGVVAGAVGAELGGVMTLTVPGSTLLLLDGSEVGADTGGQTVVGSGALSIVGGATSTVLFDGLDHNGQIDIAAGGTLRVQASSVRMGAGARFTGPGTLLVDSASSFSTVGNVLFDSTLVNLLGNATASGTISLLSGAQIVNAGDMQLGTLAVQPGVGGGNLTNAPSGVLRVQGSNVVVDTLFASAGSLLIDAGELQLRGTQSNVAGNVTLDDTGTPGMLRLSAGIAQLGATSFTMAPTAALRVDGAVVRFNDASSVPNLRLEAGRIDLFDGIVPRVTAGMQWTGGVIGRAPGVDIAPRIEVDAPLTIAGPGTPLLDGVELATLQFSKLRADLTLVNGARWSLFDAEVDFDGGTVVPGTGGGQLDLNGSVLRVLAGRSPTLAVRLNASASGVGTPQAARIEVLSGGALRLASGGFFDDALFDVAEGATLDFASGRYVWEASGFVGAGTRQMLAGTQFVTNGGSLLDGLRVSGGEFTGPGRFDLSNADFAAGAVVSGGTIRLQSSVLNSTAPVAVRDSGTVLIDGLLWQAGDFRLANGGELEVTEGGSFEVRGSGLGIFSVDASPENRFIVDPGGNVVVSGTVRVDAPLVMRGEFQVSSSGNALLTGGGAFGGLIDLTGGLDISGQPMQWLDGTDVHLQGGSLRLLATAAISTAAGDDVVLRATGSGVVGIAGQTNIGGRWLAAGSPLTFRLEDGGLLGGTGDLSLSRLDVAGDGVLAVQQTRLDALMLGAGRTLATGGNLEISGRSEIAGTLSVGTGALTRFAGDGGASGVFTGPGRIEVISSSFELRDGLRLQGSGDRRFDAGVLLASAQPVQVEAGSALVVGGSLTGDGMLDVAGSLGMEAFGGIAGTVRVAGGGALGVADDTDADVGIATLINLGDIVIGSVSDPTRNARLTVGAFTQNGQVFARPGSGVRRLAGLGVNDGTLLVDGSVFALETGGTFVNRGSMLTRNGGRFTLPSAETIDHDGTLTLDATGALDISGGAFVFRGGTVAGGRVIADSVSYLGGGTFDSTLDSQILNVTTGSSLTLTNATVTSVVNDGTLTIGGALATSGGIVNNGMLMGSGTLTGSLANNGQIAIAAGEQLTIDGGNLTTTSTITLGAGGRLLLNGDLIADGASLLGGTVDVRGNLQVMGGDVTVTSMLSADNLEIGGSTTRLSLSDLSVDSITIGSGSQLLLSGVTDLAEGAGAITLSGGGRLTLADAIVTGLLDIRDGTLDGVGTVNGNVTSSGLVSIGNSPGVLLVNGNFTQSANGLLVIEVGGAGAFEPGVNHDQLVVTGTANIDGTLRFVQLEDFDGFATRGDLLPLTYGSLAGTFANVEAVGDPDFDPQVEFGATGAVARAVVAPPGDPEENNADVSQDVAELADQQEDLENCGEEEDVAEVEIQTTESHGVGCRGM